MGGHHGADGGAERTSGARDSGEQRVSVVDPEGAAAVAQEVGDAGENDDVAEAAGKRGDEAGLLGEGERGGRVDAALEDRGARDGLDLAFVALDDGEVAGFEEGFDGVAANRGCTGSNCMCQYICLAVFAKVNERQW